MKLTVGQYDIVIEVSIRGKEISATMKYWTHTLSGLQAHDLASTLSGVISQILDRPDQTVGEIQMLSQIDKEKISQWNKVLPQTSRLCVHELIDQQCVAQPDAAAVFAWDGCLTYRELQELSTRLALYLVSRGVKPGVFVPLCLSKSCWTPVAMLAVVKAGGAFVLLDPSLPLERQKEICNQLGHSPLIIASAAHRESAASLVPGIVIAENGAIPTWPPLQVGYHGLPSVTSNDVLYAVFTSGSTGQPKGVVIEHGSYSTNAMVHIRVFDLTPNSRTLQFSGYSFDVSIFEHLTVLIAGGCLCIPSESDRYNQLAQVAARMEVNSMFLTPSVARMLSPEQIPTLKTLALVGEPMHQADINTWPLPVRLINGYGPAESTIFCSIQPKMEGTDPNNIGWPTACAFWVTNPDDPHQLQPVGGVGELLIEGPILARSYLNDQEKTAASFIKSPKWLQKFRGKSIATEECRLYRTGDLVKYTPLGSLRYLGRKDTQVKLHGQRFELADVEHHVRLHFKGAREVVADVVRPGAGDTPPILIALVARSRSWGQEEPQGLAGETLGSLDDTEFLDAVASARSRLHNVLPSYMVRTIFFPLNHVPLAKTGKADRRLLRQLVTALSLDKLDAFGRGQVAKREPASAMEWALQGLFAKVLALNPEQVSAEDHFFRLRGDSISAMNLIAEARRSNLYITVADVFNHPTLSDLAKVVRKDPTSHQPSAFVPAFALLPDDEGRRRTIWQQAVQDCSMPMDQVEDIYPCTALQEGLMALSTQKTGMYTGQLVLDLALSVDVNRLQAAWQAVVDANPILRTRLIQTESGGSFQVIARHHDIFWSQGHSVEEYLKADLAKPMKFGQPLARFALIRQPKIHPTTSSPPTMIVTMHHAIHDRWTIPLLLRQADAAYHGKRLQAKAFSPFIKHIATQDKASAQAFWKSEFAGLEAPPFPVPSAPIATHGAETRSSLERTIPVHLPADSTITLSNVIRLAWAVVISAYTDSKDVVFGLTVTGRSAPLPQVDEITGPTIATLPFRVRLGVDETIEMALAAVQQQMTRTIKFEQTGLQHIRKMSPEAAAACNFQTHLGIQPPLDTDAASALMRVRLSRADYTAFASYHLLLVCGLTAKNDAIDIHTNFDPSVIAPGEVAVLVDQFTHVLQQLCTQPRQKIGALELVSPEDMKQLRCWNSVIPAPCTSTVHDLVLQHVQEHPNEPAVQSTDTRVTFQELDRLSNRLARRLVNRGVQPGSIVPLCFEKSIWPIIAMLAVLRAGGTCVNIDPVLPAGRVQDMLKETAPAIALASLSQEQFLRDHAPGLLTVLTVPSGIEHVPDEYWAAPIADPSDAAFIIFTSGSTGRPKGIVMEHGNLSTSIRDHSGAMQVDSKSRSLHFAGYAFDASIYEIFTTLANGGCVCVPSEHERINGLASFIRLHGVNWMLVTPSVINSLRPEELPGIKTVVLGGEAVTRDNVEIWAPQKQLINGYGPAEATICAAGKIPTSGWQIGTIGPILGGIGWVTMPSNPDLLAPLGAIGELVIEGPVVTREYLNQPELTEAAFISPPSWLRRFRFPDEPGRLYRSGDLVQYTTDGWIRYAGRKDTQIKLRGQRIELGEVEHHIRSHWPGAHEVVAEVVRRGADGHESALLLAFISYDGTGGLDRDVDSIFAVPGKAFQSQASILRSQLLNIMPPYMVPAMVVPLTELPLTKTGKIDRRRLREEAAHLSNSEWQRLECGVEGSRRAPSTELEVQLRQIWSRILDIPAEDIGVDDSLFLIGGDSISAMQVVAQCRSSGFILTVAGILRSKTIAKLAGLVQIEDKSPAATGGIKEADVDFDLSPIQQMFFETAPGGHNHFNQSFLVRLARLIEPLNVARAIEALVAQHRMLRARFFKTSHGRWTQTVVENDVNNFIFTYHKVSSRQKIDSITRASQECLNITQGPLFAVDMIEVEGGALYLFLVAHHLVIDLVSWRILLGDLEELLLSGRTLGVPSTSFQTWCQLQAAYSTDNLLPEVALPHQMPAELDLEEYWGVSNDSNTCGNIEQHQFTLDAQTTRILFGPANYAFDTQPVEIFQAALLHAFIQTFADRPAPIIFTEGHGREPWDPKIDLTRTVGWFTTIWPTQAELSSDHDILEAVRRTKDSRRSVPSKGWAYFTSRYLNAGGRRAFGRHAPVEILFNYAGLYQQLERSDALLQLEPKDGIADMAKDMGRFTLIDVAVSVSADCLQYIFYVNRLMRHQDAIQRWIRNCESSLRQAAERLVSLKRSYTLSDFQGLSLTYDRLDTFLQHSLPRFGLSESDIEDIYPCSPAQRGILLSQAKNPYQYQDRVTWRATLADDASVDIQKLRHAWQKVVDRHSILRTVFMVISQEGYMDQLVLREVTADVQIEEDVISDHLTTLTQDHTRLRPSHKLTIRRDSAGVTLLELQISHALIDGSSNPIICRDLALAYDGNLSLFQQPVYRDYIAYLQGLQQESAAEYWLKYMDGVDPCYFPNLNDAEVIEETGTHTKSTNVNLIVDSRLHEFCKTHGLTITNTIHTAWALILRCYTGMDSVCFGYITSGRDIPVHAIENAVGPFFNILLRRVHMPVDASLLSILHEQQDEFINSLSHQHYPLADLYHALGLAGSTLFNTLVSVQNRRTEISSLNLNLDHMGGEHPTECAITVNITVRESSIDAIFSYDTAHVPGEQAMLLAQTFRQVLNEMITMPQKQISQVNLLSAEGLHKIVNWNERPPLQADFCAHEMIGKNCITQPDSPAVCSWDGDLTYGELDRLSTALSTHLVSRGVGAEIFVPLYFEKSRWTPVAMLGVMKAGGAFVLLDPAHQFQRLQQICQEVKAEVVLASRKYTVAAVGLVGENKMVITVSDDDTEWRRSQNDGSFQMASSVSPRNTLYVVFTSGSTGKPKGVIIEHRSFYLNTISYNQLFGLSRDSRVLQFSGYAFDLCVMEHLSTLLAGGCICIPSEFERNNQLTRIISELNANWMCLTPSVARMLASPTKVPTIKTLVLGGELMSQGDITTWSHSVRMMNAYGPAECAVIATIQPSINLQSDPRNIGRPTSSAVWITSPEDPNQLLPICAVGELLIEGPIVGRGYLNDAEKTTASFVPAPPWLHKFRGESASESRLYRTGDIGKYQSDGSILYLGRRDAQVKLRGQRIELAEVEYHVSLNFKESREVIADVIRTTAGDARQLLVALVARFPPTSRDFSHPTRGILGSPGDAEFQRLLAPVRSRLTRTLPNYMVPAIFLPLNEVPLTKTGKADRQLLHKLVSALSTDNLHAFGRYQKIYKAPITGSERRLQILFARVLGLNLERVSADDNFFQIGGDSIVAMKLVGEARQEDIYFSVADVFSQPVLSELAKLLRYSDDQPASIAAFTLLPGDEKHRMKIQRAAAESCSLDEGVIDDIYPCTALQEGLMSLTAQNSGMYTGQLIYKLADTVDLAHFQAAWQSTLDVHPILRTRIIQTEADRSLQVVVKRQPITWRRNASLEDYLTEDIAQPMMLGQPLARFALIQAEQRLDSSPSFMVLTLHHALYDGWSLQLILRYMDAAYHGTQIKTYHFAPFIKFATTEDTAAAHAFWLSEFAGLEGPMFPALPGPAVANSPGARCTIEQSVPVDAQADASVTLSNMIRLALAIVLSAHTDCEDVVFGVTLTGRNAPVAHVEDIAGPTFTTVPFRIRVVADEPVEVALAAVQEHAMQMIPFEQTGLQNIRKISPEAAAACGFRTHLGVQLAAETADPSNIMQMQNLSGAGYDAFASYPLVFVCGLTSQNDTVHVNANFDPCIVSHDEIEGLVAQFSHVLQQLRMDPTQQVGAIELVSPEDLKQLHQWNSTIPAPRSSTLHDLVLQHARERPMAVAVSFASCKLTFGDLDVLSAHLAQHIAKLGVEKGSSVPLCFEKSAWPVVAMLAVLRAGGTCVNIDPALPPGRVRDILREVAPKVALSSPSRQQLLENCAPGPLTVLTVPLHQVQVLEKNWISPVIEPHDAAFIIFTSGSTGKPKGIILEHINLSTSIHYHSSAMEVDQNSQSLHFASYAFDASIYEIFTTLVNGGCIHIPSESERVNDLAGFIHRHNINWATLTPSVISLLRPEEVPNLHTLVLGGEAVTPEIADVWAGRLQLINGYGPAEATICAAGRIPRSGWRIGTIGPMLGSVGWVTMPSDPNRLAPLGTVGELLIEGPVVARKYLNQPEQQSKETLAGFIQPPPWLSRFRYPHSPGRIYQSGDLVQLTKDGQIRYAGRKDTQVKLHGQRIELGEVEHYVRSHFEGACEVIADVITRGAGQSALLLAFIWHNISTEQIKDSNSIFAVPDGDFRQQANKVRAQLQETLPPYMVPALLLPLRKLPSTPTGKTDRRRLREEASKLSSIEYELYGNGVERPRRVPSTETEIQLQQLWVRVLKISSGDVEANSSFFHLGGNSIDAMLLVGMARQLGLELSVADVFKSPKLCDLAVAVKNNTPRASKFHQPCSLFDVIDHETFIREEIAAGQPFQPTDVIDVLPTTEFQRQFLRRNQRHYFMVMIAGSVHPTRMVAAIRALVEKHEILRTVFLPLKDTIVQVTLHRIQDGLNIVETTDVKTTAKFISEQDAQQDLPSGTPIFQATLVVGSDNHHALILRISHAQYDGVSFQHLYTDLTSAYQGNALAPASQFSDYMKCRVEVKTSQAWNFWKGFLQGSCMTYLDPHSLGGQIQPASQVLIQLRKTIMFPATPTDITMATVFKAAWALILAQSTRQQDIVFGQVVNGRGVPLDGVEKVLGACVNIVPVRVMIQPQGSALALLRQVQDQHIRTLPFETADLGEIVSQSTPWPHNTRFGSIAQHQNILLDPEISFDGMKCTTATHTTSPLPDELFVVSIPQGQNLIIEIIATNKMLSAENADRLLGELGQMVLDLTSYPNKYVSDLMQ